MAVNTGAVVGTGAQARTEDPAAQRFIAVAGVNAVDVDALQAVGGAVVGVAGVCGACEQSQCASNNKVPEIDGDHGFRGDCVSNQAVAQVAIAVSAMKIIAATKLMTHLCSFSIESDVPQDRSNLRTLHSNVAALS